MVRPKPVVKRRELCLIHHVTRINPYALCKVADLGVDRIFAHNKSLGEALIQGLEARNAQIISPRGDDERSSIVAARFPGHDPADVARGLGRANVFVSLRKDFTRLSPHLYNDAENIEKALQALDRILG